MRAGQLSLTQNPQKFVDANVETRIFMIKNRSTVDVIYLQFGNAPSTKTDAWPVLPGDTFALDPAAPRESIWIWADANNTSHTVLIG